MDVAHACIQHPAVAIQCMHRRRRFQVPSGPDLQAGATFQLSFNRGIMMICHLHIALRGPPWPHTQQGQAGWKLLEDQLQSCLSWSHRRQSPLLSCLWWCVWYLICSMARQTCAGCHQHANAIQHINHADFHVMIAQGFRHEPTVGRAFWLLLRQEGILHALTPKLFPAIGACPNSWCNAVASSLPVSYWASLVCLAARANTQALETLRSGQYSLWRALGHPAGSLLSATGAARQDSVYINCKSIQLNYDMCGT